MRKPIILSILVCLLSIGWAEDGTAQQRPTDMDISSLSDEFDDESSLDRWKQFHLAEGWPSMVRTLDINRSAKGILYLEPTQSGWYEDHQGVFLYKEVTGNFLVTARLRVAGKDAELPAALWSLAGLMVREPGSVKKENWQPGRENWLFITIGIADPAGRPVFETKTTVNSRSNLKLQPAKIGWVELGIARVRAAFILLYRYDGETRWQVRERFHRRDLARTLQVGINAYSDALSSEHFGKSPFKFNSLPQRDGKADLVLNVDYIRFRTINFRVEPQSDAGELTDHSLSNEELLKLLGI